MTETIRELDERIQGLIESLEKVDMEEEDLTRQLVKKKFLVLSLHAHTEIEKLQLKISNNSQQMKFKKQLNLYQSIESILSGKCNELSLTEMVDKLNRCKDLVSQNV